MRSPPQRVKSHIISNVMVSRLQMIDRRGGVCRGMTYLGGGRIDAYFID